MIFLAQSLMQLHSNKKAYVTDDTLIVCFGNDVAALMIFVPSLLRCSESYSLRGYICLLQLNLAPTWS